MPQAASSPQALIFRVGGEAFALPLAEVREVIRTPPLTRVPLSEPSLLGLANLRGLILPVVSLNMLLGEGGTATGERVIVIERAAPLGLAVDEVASLAAAEGEARLVELDMVLDVRFGRATRAAASSLAQTAMPDETEAGDHRQAFLSFAIGAQEFALPLESVSEVMPLPEEVAVIPETDEAMVGVVAVRERLLPLLSLRNLLGFEKGAGGRVVIADMAGITIGLVVDAARAIVRAAPEDIDPVPPVLLRGRQEAQIQAICRMDGGRRLMSILSTDHLLKDDLAARLAVDASGENIVREQDAGETEQFLVFSIGDEHFGLPLASVEEVVACPERLALVPKAPSFIEGALNLRGRVVPVVDQAARLGAQSDKAAMRRRIIVIRIGDALAGLAVDSASELLRVERTKLSPAPELARVKSRVVSRIANLADEQGRMILIVDPAELLDEAERDMVAAMSRDVPAGA